MVNFENLIQKLIQFDKHDDMKPGNWVADFGSTPFEIPDLNLSMSSHAMSSFLHDFDLTKARNPSTLKNEGDNDSYFCAETPNNRSLTVI